MIELVIILLVLFWGVRITRDDDDLPKGKRGW